MAEQRLSSRDVLIQTERIKDACTFYEQVLGLTTFLREENMIGMEAGAFRIFLKRGHAYGPVFEFYVADLGAAKARLIAAGCRVDAEDASVPKCYLRDPFGLTFNIAQQ